MDDEQNETERERERLDVNSSIKKLFFFLFWIQMSFQKGQRKASLNEEHIDDTEFCVR